MNSRYIAFAAALLMVAIPACSPGPSAELISLNLIELQEVARKAVETGHIDLSSDERYYCLRQGWSPPYEAEGEEGAPPQVAAVSRESLLRYSVVVPAERWLSFEAWLSGKWGSLQQQSAAVYVGETQIAEFEIAAGEAQEISFHIPASVQVVGDNLLSLRFSEFAENPQYLASGAEHEKNPHPGVAAYLSNVKVELGTDKRPWSSKETDPAAFRLMAEGRYLNQRSNSEIAFAADVHQGASLRLKGSVKTPKNRETTVSTIVRVRTDAEPEWTEIWRRDHAFDKARDTSRFEADVPLDNFAGGKAEISFLVLTEGRPVNERVTWTQMTLRTPPPVVEDTARQPVRAPQQMRNVMIIILDALRPDYCGCYGNEMGMTPNIDAFAEEAVVFDNAIASAPYTLASTSTLFTGLLPENHGIRRYRQFFAEELESMPEVFQQNGYRTITLTGHGYISDEPGFSRGFDDLFKLSKPEYWENKLATMDEAEMERGIDTAASAEKPLFIYAHLAPPHEPYNPPPPFNTHFTGTPMLEKWKIYAMYHDGLLTSDDPSIEFFRVQYRNNVVYADHLAGRIFAMLKENGLYDNTLIILTADHGEAFMERGAFGHGMTVADEMIRIPLIVRVPGVEHRRVAQQVGNVDWLPTLVELLELQRNDTPLDGRSIAPLLTGGEQPPADFYYSRSDSGNPVFTLRGERYKYVQRIFEQELFDLQEDPGETRNVIGSHPALAAWLRQRGMLLVSGYTARTREAELSEEIEDQLRRLGYIQ